jgi:hypothetical protein
LIIQILETVDPLLSALLPHVVRTLFTLANYLLIYYIVFGFVVSLFFGSTFRFVHP